MRIHTAVGSGHEPFKPKRVGVKAVGATPGGCSCRCRSTERNREGFSGQLSFDQRPCRDGEFGRRSRCCDSYQRAKTWDRALREGEETAVRGDAAFVWGDGGPRRNDTRRVSDEEWARSLPRMLVVMKQAKNSRTSRKAFEVSNETRAMLEGMGYVWLTDDVPFHHRIVLISHAEQILTTFGSMVVMTSYMWGGLWHGQPPRIVCLMHPGYGQERMWAVVRPARYGLQHGLEVLVSPLNAFQIPGSWSKLVIMKSSRLHPTEFRPEHATFTTADCTLDPQGATDFASHALSEDPRASAKYHYSRLNRTWQAIPRFGHRCPQYPLLRES